MATAHEEDVVIAFRQAVEEDLRRAQDGEIGVPPALVAGASTEENLQGLARSHAALQHEVALLRTIILKLVSQPLDNGSNLAEKLP